MRIRIMVKIRIRIMAKIRIRIMAKIRMDILELLSFTEIASVYGSELEQNRDL